MIAQSRKKAAKFRRKEWLIIFAIILYSFWCERITMKPEANITVYIFLKLFFCFGVWLGVYSISNFLFKGRCIDKKFKELFTIAGICFFVNMITLVFIWPGLWGGDELWLLPAVRTFNIITVQHWLIATIYIWSLMLVPYPSSIIVIFVLINLSAVFSLTSLVYEKISNKPLLYLILIPCCSFQILLFNQYPLRCSIYASFEILLFTLVYRFFKRGVKTWEIEKFSVILVLLSTLRSECIYYWGIGILLLIWLKRRKSISVQWEIKGLVLLCTGIICVNFIQTKLTQSVHGDRYTLTAVVDPIAELARVEAKKYESWRESPDLKAIDEVISIENILSSSQKGSSLMWQESFWREDVPSVKKGFWTSYISLVKNNFFVFLNERSKTFLEVQNANIYLQSKVSLDLFEPLMKDTPPMSLNIDLPGFHTINYDIYKKAIQLLTLDFSNAFFTCIRNLLNSLWIPLAGLIFFLIKNIIKKKKFLSFCSIAVLLKVPLIYLTMPGRAFMYYYPVYYIGWLCIFIEIIFLVERSRKKINYIMQSD